jgi:uncharacterized protein (TIGR01732 family)
MWGYGRGYGGYERGFEHCERREEAFECCERPRRGHGGFALIVVLFILLIIIGATMHHGYGGEC